MSKRDSTPTLPLSGEGDADKQLFDHIRDIIQTARGKVKQTINLTMVQSYWQIGKVIIEYEQQGKQRAAYGKQQLSRLSQQLSGEFGKGFDESNLRNMRRFYLQFPIQDAVRHELSWTHYRSLIKIENPSAREWYLNEAIEQNWSTRALQRQINKLYYERLLSSNDRPSVEQEAKQKTNPLQQDDNPTIGLILCSQKSEAIARYSILAESEQLFAAKYLPYLPTEEELKRELEREREQVQMQIKETGGRYAV